MQDKRPIAVLLVLVLVVAGAYFVLDGKGPLGTAGNDDESTSTTVAPDAPKPTEEDLDTAIRRVVNLENELFEDPDADRVGEIMLVKCECYADTRKRLNDLEKAGYKIDGPSLNIDRVSFVRSTPTSMEGVVRFTGSSGAVVDENGTTVEPGTSGGFQPLIYTLEKGQDGIWKIADRRLPEEIIPR